METRLAPRSGSDQQGHRVSVIIPCFNPGLLIYRALRSVEQQTRAPFEVIVVDDGSTDATKDLVAKYFPRVRLLSNAANLGVSASRNRGAAEAQGDWIAFLDADDEWMPTKLERQVDAMIETRAQVCFTGFTDLRARAHVWGRRRLSGPLCAVIEQGIPFNTSTFLVDRGAFLRAGGFRADLRSGEDLDLFYRLAVLGTEACFVPDALARYHHDNEASLTSQNTAPASYPALAASLRQLPEAADHARLHTVLRAATRHFAARHVSLMLRNSATDLALREFLDAGEGRLLSLRLIARLPSPLRRVAARAMLARYRLRQQRAIFSRRDGSPA